MKNKPVFKPVGPVEDFNRPSEVVAYVARLVDHEMEKTFKLFRQEAKRKRGLK